MTNRKLLFVCMGMWILATLITAGATVHYYLEGETNLATMEGVVTIVFALVATMYFFVAKSAGS